MFLYAYYELNAKIKYFMEDFIPTDWIKTYVYSRVMVFKPILVKVYGM